MSEPLYTIVVTSIKAKDVSGIGNILKQINYDFSAELSGHTVSESRIFELPETPEEAVLMAGLTKAGILAIVEDKDPTIPGIKEYNKYLLNKIIEENSQSLVEVPIPD